MATARTVTAPKFSLTLDGVACGLAQAVDGGDISADVVREAAGPTFFVKKHIGPPKYEDFSIEIGFGLSHEIYEWIAATLQANFMRKDGAITTADVNLNAKAERQFFHALIDEVAFPACDAASKDAATMTIKFAPEVTRTVKASGKIPAGAAKQKRSLVSNFKLELDGVDCTRVKRIDPFSVKVTLASDDIGDARDFLKEPGKIDFPNLRVTIAEGPTVASWQQWFEDFVVAGNNDESKEKNGSIVFLTPDLKSEVARVALHNVGIFALRRGADAVVADLYCQRMELQMPGLKLPKPVPPARLVEAPTALGQVPNLRVPRG